MTMRRFALALLLAILAMPATAADIIGKAR